MSLTSTTVISTVTIVKDSFIKEFTPVEATNGVLPYVYSISSPLPSGLTFNTSSGAISGTATQIAYLQYDITIVDANTQTSPSSFNLVVQSETIPYLERIATALETVAVASTSTGIRTVGAYDWTRPTEVYSWYNQNLSPIAASSATANTLVNEITTITNSMPKFI